MGPSQRRGTGRHGPIFGLAEAVWMAGAHLKEGPQGAPRRWLASPEHRLRPRPSLLGGRRRAGACPPTRPPPPPLPPVGVGVEAEKFGLK